MTVRELIEALEALNQDNANVVVCALDSSDPYISASQDLHHIELEGADVVLIGDHSDHIT